jgi:hypothetical protein
LPLYDVHGACFLFGARDAEFLFIRDTHADGFQLTAESGVSPVYQGLKVRSSVGHPHSG